MSKFKYFGLILAITVIVPLVIALVYFAHLYLVSAFPSNSLAAERFEDSGLYKFPEDVKDVYFRIAMPSPLDRGGSALRFSAGDADLAKILGTVPSGVAWQTLERAFHCNCLQCLRYAEPVKVPVGSLYWRRNKGSSDYQFLAVHLQTQQVFWCEQET